MIKFQFTLFNLRAITCKIWIYISHGSWFAHKGAFSLEIVNPLNLEFDVWIKIYNNFKAACSLVISINLLLAMVVI
jgi:hypothetical protein